jgi:hypothetical protein
VGLGVVVALGSAPSIIAAGVACALAGVVYFVGANLAGNRAAVELMSPLLKRL